MHEAQMQEKLYSAIVLLAEVYDLLSEGNTPRLSIVGGSDVGTPPEVRIRISPPELLQFPALGKEVKGKTPHASHGDEGAETPQPQNGQLEFTDKEILKMPTDYRDYFRKKKGKHPQYIRYRNGVYEIRCRINGVDITASSRNYKAAKEKFIEKLRHAPEQKEQIPSTFTAFTLFYFENFRKRKVSEKTYKADLWRLKRHLTPYFGETPLKQITALSIQKFLDNLLDQGKGKTADELHSLLNMTFKMAINYNLLTQNPINIVFHQQHQTVSGHALTYAEEARLLSECEKGYQVEIAVALYTGLRPNEYPTAHLKDGMIIAVNSKRKNKRVEYKRIPVNPMLQPYLEGVEEIHFHHHQRIRDQLKAILPEHKLYDLRTTFYTRCKECNIADAARDEMMGHSLGKLGNAYTDLSDEYLKREAVKFRYEIPNVSQIHSQS